MPASVPRRFRLPREQRLRHSREYAAARETGLRAVRKCLIANLQPLTPPATARLGVVTSRKVGPAVVRSRARRLLREAFRLNQDQLRCPAVVVLVARPAIARCGLQEVERELKSVWREAGLLSADR
ncbi:MAG: ribonuclease P protein component [Verrucomicrobia bacterium]|jgi:ribonuclease P protein component|nr:ribonuclease P protein component [Verrucomicrobiota bacterium]